MDKEKFCALRNMETVTGFILTEKHRQDNHTQMFAVHGTLNLLFCYKPWQNNPFLVVCKSVF